MSQPAVPTTKKPAPAIDRILWIVVGLGLLGATAYLLSRGLSRTFNGNGSDFEIYFWAAEAMVKGGDIYNAATGEYVYPPLVAWILTPLTPFGVAVAMRVWVLGSMLLTGISIWVLARDMARRLDLRADPLLIASVSLLTLLANFDVIRWEFEFGQADAIVLLGFALGLRWLDKRPWLAAVALGLAFTVKYQSLLALPYLIMRRRFTVAAAMIVASAVFLYLPALTYGWGPTARSVQSAFVGLLYSTGLASGQGAESAAHVLPAGFPRSFSITSVACRLTDGLNHPGRMMAVAAGAAVVLLAIGVGLYRRRAVPLLLGRFGPAEGQRPLAGVVAIEWVGLIVVALAFSPLTGARHTFLLVPAHVLAFTILCRPRSGVNPWPLALGTLAFTLGVMLPPGNVRPESALATWRAIGGTTWCMLAFYFSLVWTGLGYVRATPAAGTAAPP